MKNIFLIVGIILYVNSCIAESVTKWDYQFKIHGSGTKSESISGKLLYKEHELSPIFEHVITPIGEFAFCPLMGPSAVEVRWVPFCRGIVVSDKGIKSLFYKGDPDFRKCFPDFSLIKKTDLPYISGKFLNRPENVGPDWFYIVKKSIWVNPDKMDVVVKLLSEEPPQ